jgi:type II secretory ATPase GspE/PulE/Tfp pilus assembly ATPase PilB-like protein
MIGEIRDKVTAQIAIEAALTGHLVLSTLHTNDAAGAITRLLDMGVEPFLISATLSGVIAQRLARKLCSNCKQEVTNASRINKSVRPDPARPELVEGVEGFTERTQNMPNFEQFTGKVYSAPGCSKCFNLGHKGRIGIFELLVLDEKIKDLITQKASNEDIQKHALSNGMLSLQNDGIQKLNLGQISFEEFLANVEV